MKPYDPAETWETVSRKAYWDRDVPLDRWREKISVGHPSYLPDAVASMGVAEFIHFFGTDSFLRDWPRLRTHLPAAIAATRAGIYDLAWSRLAGGGWNLRPTPDFHSMPARRGQFLVEVARMPGRSIYALAQALGMQYRRAHDHAVALIGERKIRGVETVQGGRRRTKLYPVYAD